MEVTNKFKGLDLIDRVPEELWVEVCDIVQELVIKTIPKKKKHKKAKWLSEEALQTAEKRKEVKGKGEKEKYIYLNEEFQRIAQIDKKTFLNDQCKEIEENNRKGKTSNIFKKIRYTKGIFHASKSHSVMSNSLLPHGLYSPWNSPGQSIGVCNLFITQGIFQTQGYNPGLLHCRWILYQLSLKGSSRILKGVAYPFSSWSSWLRNRTGQLGTIKDRNGMDLTEADNIKKRWQEYTEELYKKRS